MSVTLRELTLADAVNVCSGMRDEDRRCMLAMRGDITDEEFAASMWQSYGPAWSVLDAGRVVAICGMFLPNDWTGVLWLVGTPGMTSESWRKLLRHGRTVIASATEPGGEHYRHRIEAHALVGWGGAQRFAERLGLQIEATRYRAGRHGESVNVWVRLGPPKENGT